MYIVQFQSRVLVFIQWALQDLTFNRGAQLITGPAATDFDFNMRGHAHRSHNLTDAIESLPSGLHRPKHKEHHDIL